MAEELLNLGRNMNAIMFDKRISQKQLAKCVGISCQMINYIMYGQKKPSAETLIKISKALDTSVDDLIK